VMDDAEVQSIGALVSLLSKLDAISHKGEGFACDRFELIMNNGKPVMWSQVFTFRNKYGKRRSS